MMEEAHSHAVASTDDGKSAYEAQISTIQKVFQRYDEDNTGTVALSKIGELLEGLGRDKSKAEAVIAVFKVFCVGLNNLKLPNMY